MTWVTRWWAGEAGAAGKALATATAPAEWLFSRGVRLRNGAFDRGVLPTERVPVPVISIGNLAVGGAGKTPFAAWIAARLLGWGRKPAVALRGYGGDEVLLHRELNPDVPVFAAKRRVEAAREAVAAGRDVVVLDDGFQHRALARDLDVVLVAAETWTRTPRLLPRGPWREGLAALGRADVVVVTRKSASFAEAERVAAEVSLSAVGKPVAVCALRPDGLSPVGGGDRIAADVFAGREVLAVAALATPAPFISHLGEMGMRAEAALFRDHHPFSAGGVEALARRAAGRPLVMTRKDAVKLRPLLPETVEAYVLEQAVAVETGGEALDAALRRALEARG